MRGVRSRRSRVPHMNHESETTADPGGEQAADDGEQSALGSPLEGAASILKRRNAQIVAAAVVVALAALVVVLVRGCGGGDDPAASLSNAASGIASRLNDAADDVGDSGLDDAADEATDAARRLARVAEPDYGDLDDVDATNLAIGDVDSAIWLYGERAAQIAESAVSEGRAEAALDAARIAASFVANSSWHEEWNNLYRIWWSLDLERNARRYDEKDVDRYVEAQEALNAAWTEQSKASAEFSVARAEMAVASFRSDTARSRARDALKDAEEDLDDADSELERAYDDVDYFRGLITWRDG